jgi:hypothetical protein
LICCRNGIIVKYGPRSLTLISGILYNINVRRFGNIFESGKEAAKKETKNEESVLYIKSC